MFSLRLLVWSGCILTLSVTWAQDVAPADDAPPPPPPPPVVIPESAPVNEDRIVDLDSGIIYDSGRGEAYRPNRPGAGYPQDRFNKRPGEGFSAGDRFAPGSDRVREGMPNTMLSNPLDPMTDFDGREDPLKEEKCPKHWLGHGNSCYKFIRSPVKDRNAARELCRALSADLVSVSDKNEHLFLTQDLQKIDPHHRTWYTSGTQRTTDVWENDGDGSSFQDMTDAILPDQESTPYKNFLAYTYSYRENEWGLLKVDGSEEFPFICEISADDLAYLIDDDLEHDHSYGKTVGDPDMIPRGPTIVRQPLLKPFDVAQRKNKNYISVTCLAEGYPYPKYGWYKESYENDVAVYKEIDPLLDPRWTVSGGTFIINDPNQIEDRGRYHCRAYNKFGSVTSESVQVTFAYVGEFNLKRSNQQGNQFWGKAIYCDPPQHFPGVHYYWARDYFPNFIEEDRRTMVSQDGNLYFSYLDRIDRGKLSCNVKGKETGIGKNGPWFQLDVFSHPNYQQLKFANNFPKAFPEAPARGQEVRLECIAFGYPVPHYNWTRKGGDLPLGAQLSSYNRVLTLPSVEPSDVGDYVCKAENNRISIQGTISLSIQAKPSFTIPLRDQFIAKGHDLQWECEAFGIPDVDYAWLRNSEKLTLETLDDADRARYGITESILTIKSVEEKDQAIYQCKATNQLGSTYSSAQLTILQLAPTFIKKPLEPEMYASEGMNATIVCNPEASPRPDFVWRKDSLVLGQGGRRHILRNGNLVITPVSRDDAGTYTCTAKNIFGEDTSSGKLIVLREPEFYKSPPDIIREAVGRSITMECEAYTDEILDTTYMWQHNDMRIELDETKYLKNLAYELGYDYDEGEKGKIDVLRDAIMQRKQKEQEISYRRRFPPYERGDRPGHLRIQDLTLEDAGVYKCIMKTPIASIRIETRLVVQGPPGPPGGIISMDLTSTSGRIQWTDGASNGRVIETYNIQDRTSWDRDEGEDWVYVATNVTAKLIDESNGRREFQLNETALTPWASHEFRIQGVNILGEGQWSTPSPQSNSKQDRPFIFPHNLRGGGGKTGDLLIEWDPLHKRDQNAPGIYYKVFWRRVGVDPEPDFQKLVMRERGNVGMLVVDIGDRLKYFWTKFEVKIQAFNNMGAGPVSPVEEMYSAEDMPQVQPTAVGAWPLNATCINVTWKAIEPSRENIRGQLVGYRIKYWPQSNNELEELESQALIKLHLGANSHGLIVGLVPDTQYWMRVMAYNRAGSGPESERFLERTWRYPPLMPPSAVHVKPIDPNTIYVTWRGVTPGPKEETLEGYKIKIWESSQDFTQANDTIIPVGEDLLAYIENLTPGKSYKLRVLAYSRGGDGKLSSPPWEFQMGDPDILRGFAPRPVPYLGSTIFTTFLVAFLTPILHKFRARGLY